MTGQTGAPATPSARGLAIYGGYGGVNVGDEMLLRAAVLQARAKGYRGEIVAIGPVEPPADAVAVDYHPLGVRFVTWRAPLAALRAVAGRDLFVGGGQLIDGGGGVKVPGLILALALASRATGGRLAIGGVSTARLESPAVRRAFGLLFRLADRIVTRDEASLGDIAAIAPSSAGKSESQADLVFGMRDAFAGGAPAAERETIAFAVHRATKFRLSDADETEAFLRRLAARLQPGQRVAILAHDRRETWDLGLARELAARIGSDRVFPHAFASAEECIAFYKTVRTAISVRMHPIILGACAGAFCVPLQGSRKVADIGMRLGVPVPALGELLTLDDTAFDDALGLGDVGPMPEAASIEAMSEAALRTIRPAR
jgi:polysaccharide pyruvyl transferase WcaK-like protein